MPKEGNFDLTYPNKLLEIGLELNESFKGAKKHHSIKCLECNNIFTATPISKLQNFKKHKLTGCPDCSNTKKYNDSRQQNLQILTDKGLLYPDWWTGQRVWDKDSTQILLPVTQTNCGHSFTSTVINLLSTDMTCSVCGKEERTSHINKWSLANSEEWKKTADIWQMYKSRVTKLSRISYKKNKEKINPNNLPTGRAGIEGAYHIDHIVPMRYCFINHIPEELCAHPDNLQMLGWRDNVGSRDKLKEYVPDIFKEFLELPSFCQTLVYVANKAVQIHKEVKNN